ncbi:MAG: ferritin-like domain-containing protein [Terriglobales bacterium]
MIRLLATAPSNLNDPHSVARAAAAMLQTAVGIEFGTLPPYLYALYSLREGANQRAAALIQSVVLEEMTHLCLAANILNALGGDPVLVPGPRYPTTLPGDIGPPGGSPLLLHLLPFSREAMQQAMQIEEPVAPPDYPVIRPLAATAGTAEQTQTIGEFYAAVDAYLEVLPPEFWQPGRNQIGDRQYFAGQIYPVLGYSDAHRAIGQIVSEGEGTSQGTAPSPLDFHEDLAHYYRFSELFQNLLLHKADQPLGYQFGPDSAGVDWEGVYPAIADPSGHDFSGDPPEARAAQAACNLAYSQMLDALQAALRGNTTGAMGQAVGAMYALRRAARAAMLAPLADAKQVAGPAFLYSPPARS